MKDIIETLASEVAEFMNIDRQMLENAIRNSIDMHGIIVLDSNESDNCCFHKAHKKGEPTFTLRAQDLSSDGLVREWVHRNPQLPEHRKQEALHKAELMHRWPHRKAAD